ncbi:hypothetical protein K443DRAFT_521090 [Laccaria amethystina LaAM-08-1]|uniref:Unplaced genomic scaffold K443scaffold_58, whole genome shotgun sequence n=1 Tax=Laccaria amethystina LaAM-08-1 TaxID=1095629 RepID=A0A0C9XXM6_9AGAR|nr:hypothetical protein K443DRAFT_521090 [Laccaria amethystina LaAM-08-1]
MGDSHTYTNNYLMWIAYDLYSFLYPIMSVSSHYRRFITPIHTNRLTPHPTTSQHITTIYPHPLISSPSLAHPSIHHPHLPRFFSLDCIKNMGTASYDVFGWVCWEVVLVWNFMSRLMLTGILWYRCRLEHVLIDVGSSYIFDRPSRPHHYRDPLDAVSSPISTLPPGSSQRHHTSPALPKVQCWVGDRLNVPRSRLISYSLSRLALSVLFSPSFHSLPQRPTHAFRIWRWLPSCLDFARPHPILFHQADPHNHSPSSLKCCCFGSPSASRLFLFSPSWLLH